jgi:hypothetical protein
MTDGRRSFEEYLDTLPLADPIRKRALGHYDRCQQLTDEEIVDGFLSEPHDGDAKFPYKAVWLFATTVGFEVWNFVNEDSIDVGSAQQTLTRLEVEPHEYDMGDDVGEDARLVVTVYVGYGHDKGGATGTLKASGPNCLQLRRVLLKHLIPALPAGSRRNA